MEQLIEKLTKMFEERYAKQFAELNKNLVEVPRDEKGRFKAPVIKLGSGGGTLLSDNSDGAKLNAPAVVEVSNKPTKPFSMVYRIAVPLYELEIAADKPSYFNHLMDTVLTQAVANFKHTVGGDENIMRFGEVYCTYKQPGNKVFEVLGEHLEVRLYGSWSSGIVEE